MDYETYNSLEETPENLKNIFRIIQDGEEVNGFEHGQTMAIYCSNESPGRETDLRWARIGKYDERENMMVAEYLLTYNPGEKKLGGQLNFKKLSPHRTNGKSVSIPEDIYEESLEDLHALL